jgi:hypothetical protein
MGVIVKGAITIGILFWVVVVVSTVFILTGVVYPWTLSLWYGSCWADARANLRDLGSEMEGAIRSPNSPPIEYRLTIEECIAGVILVNGKENRDEYSKLFDAECREYTGFKSYMIAIPYEVILTIEDPEFAKLNEKYQEMLKDLKDSLKIWDVIKLWIKDKMGRIPPSYCREFEHEFSSSPSSIKSIPKGFMGDWKNMRNTGKEPYCLHIYPREIAGTQGGFNYVIEQKTCPPEPPEEPTRDENP